MYILAIDQSTSATKAVLFGKNGLPVQSAAVPHRQYYPAPGWVEHDAEEIYANTLEAIRRVLGEAGVAPSEIAAIGISNQRETVLVWERSTAKPIGHAVVWQCGRAAGICTELEKQGAAQLVLGKTGLVLSPYFSAPKIRWILDNTDGAREKAKAGELAFGTVDSWLLWKLTGGRVHRTDYTNACRSMLFNIHTLQWDRELLDLFGVPMSMAPEVRFSDEVFGYTQPVEPFNREIPIAGLSGDSHAAFFAQSCFAPGMAKATYGTGSSIMMNVGASPVQPSGGLVSTIGFGAGGHVDYAVEGNINCTGDTIRWLAEDLELIPNAAAAGPIATSVESNAGVYMVPAFTGLGAPYWDALARASVTGISRGVRKAHIVRAAEESIAYQVRDVLETMAQATGITPSDLRVDGGPIRDSFLMQFQADILGTSVVCGSVGELSAQGAAFFAGLAVGFWNSRAEIENLRRVERVYRPNMNQDARNKLYGGWKEAVRRTLSAG